jgi:hypothetical protein
MGGAAPRLTAEANGATLLVDGFRRLGGPTQARRRWSLSDSALEICDSVQGTGRHQIERRLVTPLPVTRDGDTVHLHLKAGDLHLVADGPLTLRTEKGWTVWGAEIGLTVITVANRVNLPWQGKLTLERKDV